MATQSLRRLFYACKYEFHSVTGCALRLFFFRTQFVGVFDVLSVSINSTTLLTVYKPTGEEWIKLAISLAQSLSPLGVPPSETMAAITNQRLNVITSAQTYSTEFISEVGVKGHIQCHFHIITRDKQHEMRLLLCTFLLSLTSAAHTHIRAGIYLSEPIDDSTAGIVEMSGVRNDWWHQSFPSVTLTLARNDWYHHSFIVLRISTTSVSNFTTPPRSLTSWLICRFCLM